MDIGRSLVTKIIDEGRLNEVQRAGITEDFLDDDSASIFNYIKRHYSTYKKVPTRDTVKTAHPNFDFTEASEPVEYYIDTLKETYRRKILEGNLNEIAEVYSRDTQKAETLLRSTLSQISVTAKSHQDVDFATTATDRLAAYQERKRNPGVNGTRSGWPSLDNQTLGWQPEDFVVLVGEKYMGKSWKLLYLAHQALLQNEKVLFNTKEMSQDAVVRRLDSIYSQVPFDALRKGELTHAEEERYSQKLNEIADSTYNLVIARQGIQTVQDIETKAVETDASIIFADSVYLFDPDTSSKYSGETSKRLAISQKCKSIAQNLGIPFVVSVQAGRKKTKKPQKPDLDNIEWSNAFSQDADTVFHLHKDELDKELKRAQIWLLKSRDGDTCNFFIDQNFEYMEFGERSDRLDPTTQVFEDDEEEGLFDD